MDEKTIASTGAAAPEVPPPAPSSAEMVSAEEMAIIMEVRAARERRYAAAEIRDILEAAEILDRLENPSIGRRVDRAVSSVCDFFNPLAW